MTIQVEDIRLIALLKQAVMEVMEERQEVLRELVEEEVEDLMLSQLIERNMDSGLVSEEQIMRRLQVQHAD